MAKWPNKEELDKILPELEKVEGTLHLNKNASPLDRFRWELCQRILKYQIEHDLKQKELAKMLNIDEPQMSRILRHRIEKVSTDKLASFVLKLEPGVELKVS
jgi:predicted XRE-type DNA-binding protein